MLYYNTIVELCSTPVLIRDYTTQLFSVLTLCLITNRFYVQDHRRKKIRN